MKRALFTSLACTLAASFSLADTPAQTKETSSVEARVLVDHKSGTIMNVDVEKEQFTLVAEEAEIVISFDAKTKFVLDGKEVDAERLLKIGTEVQVVLEGDRAVRVQATTE